MPIHSYINSYNHHIIIKCVFLPCVYIHIIQVQMIFLSIIGHFPRVIVAAQHPAVRHGASVNDRHGYRPLEPRCQGGEGSADGLGHLWPISYFQVGKTYLVTIEYPLKITRHRFQKNHDPKGVLTIIVFYPRGGVQKWGYPQSSSIFNKLSIINHPAMVAPWLWKAPHDRCASASTS